MSVKRKWPTGEIVRTTKASSSSPRKKKRRPTTPEDSDEDFDVDNPSAASTSIQRSSRTVHDFDKLIAESTLSTSTASTRPKPFEAIPSLISCCIRKFARTFRREFGGGGSVKGKEVEFAVELSRKQKVILEDLEYLPGYIRVKVWERLKLECPEVLSVALICRAFLDQSDVSLPGATLPHVAVLKATGVLRFPDPAIVTSLEITDTPLIPDHAIVRVVGDLPNLKRLNLRGCTLVADKTCQAIRKLNKSLVYLNLGETATDVIMLRSLIFSCLKLEGLKLADCKKLAWTGGKNKLEWDSLAAELFKVGEEEERPLSRLRSLKLRNALPSQASWDWIYCFVCLTRTLERLDISHLQLRPSSNMTWKEGFKALPIDTLQKFNCLSTSMAASDLLLWLGQLPQLRILRVSFKDFVSPVTIERVSDVIEWMKELEELQVEGQFDKMAVQASQRCRELMEKVLTRALIGTNVIKDLTLTGSPFTNRFWSDLQVELQEAPSCLRSLSLVGMNVTDEAAETIARCTELEVLDLSSNTIDESAVFTILRHCPMLNSVDLTSCRGVPVSHRRNIFKVFEESERGEVVVMGSRRRR